MITKRYILEIQIDEENIREKNTHFDSYDSMDEFIASEINQNNGCQGILEWGSLKRIVRPVSYEPSMNDEYQTPFMDAVLEEVKKSVHEGDVESLDEVLRFIPRTNLVQYAIPEEEWGNWMTSEELNDIYEGRSKQ